MDIAALQLLYGEAKGSIHERVSTANLPHTIYSKTPVTLSVDAEKPLRKIILPEKENNTIRKLGDKTRLAYDTEIHHVNGSKATVNLHIEGNEFANNLIGGKGNDVLVAKGSGDTLIGGEGADYFALKVGSFDAVIKDKSRDDFLTFPKEAKKVLFEAKQGENHTYVSVMDAQNNLISSATLEHVKPIDARRNVIGHGPLEIEVKEPKKPEVKAEPKKPEVKTEPKKPEVKAEPKKPEVKTEPKKPEVKAEPKKPEGVSDKALAEAVLAVKKLDFGHDKFATKGGIVHSGPDGKIGAQEIARISTHSANNIKWGDVDKSQNLQRNFDLSFKLDLDKDGRITQEELNKVIGAVKASGTEVDQAAFERAFRDGNAALPRPVPNKSQEFKK